jgi:aminopeptidase N
MLLFAGLLWAQPGHARPLPDPGFHVVHYTARLDPDLPRKTLRGTETISVALLDANVRQLDFDAGELTIDEVSLHGRKLSFEKTGHRLDIRLASNPATNRHLDIKVRYHGAPRFGLEFHPQTEQLYTIFSTSQWLVCLDAPDQRASLDLSVALPNDFKAIATGRLISRRRLGDQRVLYHWRQQAPVPSYVYGFAAGRFNEADARANGVDMRFLSRDMSPDQLRQLFTDTGDMLKFFGDRAGIPYRDSYDQALVTRTIGQEMAGLALLSEAYGRDALQTPVDEDLIAHEAAHQWWGIKVTCRSWSDFWLNEGFADFMAAAYIQHWFVVYAYL